MDSEIKLMDEREFLFYTLMTDKNICTKLRSWHHDNRITENNKGLITDLIHKIH